VKHSSDIDTVRSLLQHYATHGAFRSFSERQIEYGTKKAVHLIHDVLMDFLNEPQYVQYNIDHFNLNPEMA
jgi:hypothetical protein